MEATCEGGRGEESRVPWTLMTWQAAVPAPDGVFLILLENKPPFG